MTRDLTKIALRRHEFKRWKQGVIKAYGGEPSKEMVGSFLAGFNMGYSVCKTKRFKE